MFNRIRGQKPKYLVQQDTLRVKANLNVALQRCMEDTDVFLKKQLPQMQQQEKKAVANIGLLARTASKLMKKK